MGIMRMVIIILIILIILVYFIYQFIEEGYTYDFAKIVKAKPDKKILIKYQSQLSQVLKDNPSSHFSIAGAKFSHGGQTMLNEGIYLDMIGLDKIISLDKERGEVTVEGGVTWNKLQRFLDQHNLSVGEMQSYRNFSVGGSISVNCHGRGMKYPTIAESIIKLKVMLISGEVIECSPILRRRLFQAVVGGYGLLGIIVEATLKIEPNSLLTRHVLTTSTKEISQVIRWMIKQENIEFYNCNIYPSRENQAVHIYFTKEEGNNCEQFNERLQPGLQPGLQPEKEKYWLEMIMEQLLRRIPVIKEMRAVVEPKQLQVAQTIPRNYEMSYDVRQIQPLLRFPTTSILQEYFIPIDDIDDFLEQFWRIIYRNNVNLLNLSIRYVGRTVIPLLNYTQHKHTIALVLYLNLWNNSLAITSTEKWTQEIIDLALKYRGTYYLPYLPFATKKQFERAYPRHQEFIELKKKVDPNNRLRSIFSQKYF